MTPDALDAAITLGAQRRVPVNLLKQSLCLAVLLALCALAIPVSDGCGDGHCTGSLDACPDCVCSCNLTVSVRPAAALPECAPSVHAAVHDIGAWTDAPPREIFQPPEVA